MNASPDQTEPVVVAATKPQVPAEPSIQSPISSNGMVSFRLLVVVGGAIAVLVTNLYFAQPLILDIAASLRIAPRFAGAVTSASQFGYGLGLFVLVPLSDIFENRRLVLGCGAVALCATIGLAVSTSATAFLICAVIVGVFSSGAQILIPFLSHILPPETRGRVIGAVMAGVLTAVMFARPFALFVAATLGWRAIYWISAAATVVLGASLARLMPERTPGHRISYARTIGSMPGLLWREPGILRRTLYQSALFAVFTMFWAVTPMMLAQMFHLDPVGIGLFALAGAGGALAAPIAGRAADQGFERRGTLLGCLVTSFVFLGTIAAVNFHHLLVLAALAIVIDAGFQSVQAFSRLIILNVAPDRRGRVNALYMTIVYSTGALGSIIGVSLYVTHGWPSVAWLCASLALAVAVLRLTETTSSPSN